MRKLKGFTLIELLIVVAIIAILAAIAIPNFLEAQTRSRVSRIKSDMRSMATAIEAYMVDQNLYPAAFTGSKSVNWGLPTGNARYRMTFANAQARVPLTEGASATNHFLTLTTPSAYIGSIATDNFADEKTAALGYAAKEDAGWIMWSYGPDADESTGGGGAIGVANGGGQVGPWLELFANATGKGAGALPAAFWGSVQDSVYNGQAPLDTHGGANPADSILNLRTSVPGGGSMPGAAVFLYDPSNGTTSQGDIISVQGTGPL